MPEQLGGSPEPMDWPAVVVIEERSDGVFLFRFTDRGEVVGDTWHVSEADARRQARAEYGDLLGPWKEVPANVADEQLWRVVETNEG